MGVTLPPAVILAGGLGSRLAEETHLIPKPMVTVGGRPILWHIMKIYAACGVTDFFVACGYKGYVIKEYFAQYALHSADVTVSLGDGSVRYLEKRAEPWTVTLVDTGELTMTGGRLGRLRRHLPERFFVTYGDGVADIDISQLLSEHMAHGRLATVTITQPAARFGQVLVDDGAVREFSEKPVGGEGRISAGFFVFERAVLDLIDADDCVLERDVLPALAAEGQLMAYHHEAFWRPMDTLRDRQELEALWSSGEAPWAVWGRSREGGAGAR